MTFPDETANLIYAGILAEPHDTLRRLVLADWLQEAGLMPEFEEFVRLQCAGESGAMTLWDLLHHSASWFPQICKATGNSVDDWGVCHDGSVHYDGKHRVAEFWVRNGFPAEVRCPWAWWFGGECGSEDCYSGDVGEYERCPYTGDDIWVGEHPCPTCHGTGRTPGHGEEIVRRWPVTKVVISDADEALHNHGDVFWWRDDEIYDHGMLLIPAAMCPREEFPTRESALNALSDAILNHTRAAVGLPPLRSLEAGV